MISKHICGVWLILKSVLPAGKVNHLTPLGTNKPCQLESKRGNVICLTEWLLEGLLESLAAAAPLNLSYTSNTSVRAFDLASGLEAGFSEQNLKPPELCPSVKPRTAMLICIRPNGYSCSSEVPTNQP